MNKTDLEKIEEPLMVSMVSNGFSKSQIEKSNFFFCCFVDLSTAFDHIPRNWLFGSIKMRFPDNPPRLFIILEQLYKQTTLTFQESNTFATTSGVRQGGPESPFLFNLYIDYVMRVFMTEAQ